MKIEMREIGGIKPYIKNPRKNEQAVADVAASIEEFGFRQPIVVDGKNTIIIGHTRYKAAKKLGLKEVPVHVAENLTQEQIKALRIKDNKTAELAEWDYEILPVELSELSAANYDIESLGFDNDEISKILEGLIEDEKPDDDIGATDNGFEYKETYAITVVCDSEEHQQKVYADLVAQGLNCKVVVV